MKPALAQELDREILAYVREMQQHGPVQAEAICRFVQVVRRRRVTALDIQDRLLYLSAADRRLLESHTEWQDGEFTHYTITADGMDVLDGALPPPNWRPE